LLRYDNVQIVFRLVDMRTHRYNARQPMWICLRGTRRRCVHDAVFGRTEEICRTTESIQHSGAHYTSTVCVCVDVYFDRGVHANYTKTSDDFRVVGDLL
jgi:hypothetical protein